MKTIKQVLKEKTVWRKKHKEDTFFISDTYPEEVCNLTMNDFPDEPMWTLKFYDESIDFDNNPKNWEIIYS